MNRALAALLLLTAFSLPCAANQALEEKTRELAGELRCLVCQNQTLADSNAELAVDMRNRIREELARGRSREEVVDLMVQRYGDFVLYRPPLKARTVLLWAGPFLLLAAGVAILAWQLRRRRHAAKAEAELDEAERSRAAELLGRRDA